MSLNNHSRVIILFSKETRFAEQNMKRHSRPSRPRYEWRWGEAWSSATTSTTAKCGVGGTSSSSSGRPRGPDVAPGVSCNPYGTDNLWCRPASRTRSCWDARRGAPPSDPGLRHGRTPIFPGSEGKAEYWEIMCCAMAHLRDVPRLSTVTKWKLSDAIVREIYHQFREIRSARDQVYRPNDFIFFPYYLVDESIDF